MQRNLIFLLHGLHGTSDDWDTFIRIWKMNDITNNSSFFPLKSYPRLKTHLGIQELGEITFSEVKDILEQYKGVRTNLIFVGHSLGGLILRYLIMLLSKETSLFEEHDPIAFFTLATPNLGTQTVRNPVRYLGVNLVTTNLGKTGEDLMHGSDLLYRMTEGDFTDAINKFKKGFLFSNIFHDLFVTYCTSSIVLKNPYMKKDSHDFIERLDNFPSVVKLSDKKIPMNTTRKHSTSAWDLLRPLLIWKKKAKKNLFAHLNPEDKSGFNEMIIKFNSNVKIPIERVDVGLIDPDCHCSIACKRGSCYDIVFYCQDLLRKIEQEK